MTSTRSSSGITARHNRCWAVVTMLTWASELREGGQRVREGRAQATVSRAATVSPQCRTGVVSAGVWVHACHVP